MNKEIEKHESDFWERGQFYGKQEVLKELFAFVNEQHSKDSGSYAEFSRAGFGSCQNLVMAKIKQMKNNVESDLDPVVINEVTEKN